jgi:hypothetical protein
MLTSKERKTEMRLKYWYPNWRDEIKEVNSGIGIAALLAISLLIGGLFYKSGLGVSALIAYGVFITTRHFLLSRAMTNVVDILDDHEKRLKELGSPVTKAVYD